MNANSIDTLGIFDRLKKSFTEDQAHAISEILKEVHMENLKALANKSDLLQLKYDLTIRMGAMFVGAVAILTAIIEAAIKLK